MRLVDADELYKEAEKSLVENPHTKGVQRSMHVHEHKHFQSMILDAPTIDPKTLPVVKMLKGLCDTMSKIIKDQREQLNKSRMKSEELYAELEKVKAERDAVMKQLHGYCPACKNYTENQCDGPCSECKHEYYQYKDASSKDNWEWCGVREEA